MAKKSGNPSTPGPYPSHRRNAPPLLLATKQQSEIVVAHACHIAQQRGVHRLMPLALATTIVPNAMVIDYDLTKDLEALGQIALWATRFAPYAAPDITHTTPLQEITPLSYGITLDLTGMERFHKDFYSLAERIWNNFHKKNISAYLGFGPTIGAAWALSRCSGSILSCIDTTEQIPTILAPLPLTSLRLEAATIDSLHDLGIDTVGALLSIPRRSLGERYGSPTLKRLRQALGEVAEELPRYVAPTAPRISRSFEQPLTIRAAIENAVITLIKDIIAQLHADEKIARRFLLSLEGLDDFGKSFSREREFSLTTATARESHLTSLIIPLLDSIHFPGAVTEVRLEARQCEKMRHTQHHFFSPVTHQSAQQETINHLVVRLGKERVNTVAYHHSYLPERAASFVPLAGEKPPPDMPHFLPRRPSFLFTRPEPLEALALLPDRPPHRLQWRGDLLLIAHAQGPERIAPEWWNQRDTSPHIDPHHGGERDYFTLCDHHHRWLWVYRDNSTQQWFLHGLWM